MNNNWFKKEKPLPSMIGLGGGATGLDKSAGGAVDRATGGTITYEGGKTIHTFVSPGTFENYNPAGALSVRYLVVGGGGGGGGVSGGGGGGVSGGGGGAGQVRTITGYTEPLPGSSGSPQPYPITIGGAGSGGSGNRRVVLVRLGVMMVITLLLHG